MTSDGSDVKQLTSLTAAEGAASFASWSPDGKRIVYAQFIQALGVAQIFLMDADGSNQHQLLVDPNHHDASPSFSPDGRSVIFTRFSPDFEGAAVYTVKVDGQGLNAITNLSKNVSSNVYDQSPKFSPDGNTISITSFNRGGVTGAIYLMDRRGSNVRMVTPSGLGGWVEDWAPNGRQLALSSNCCMPGHLAIWAVGSDGTGLTQLTFPGKSQDFGPSYSPDGTQIAFERDSGDFSTFDLLIMNGDGTHVKTILKDAGNPVWGPST
jgi:Tol biopolymer transport system component